MKITKVKDVKTPTRGTELSAGIDFYIPNDFADFGYILNPGHSVNIPSGIKVRVPKGYALIAFNKSGIAVKKHLQVGACVIDEDYQGEIHLHVFNVGNKPIELMYGDKLVQFILIKVNYEDVELVENSELFDSETKRGEKGFGSTGI